MEETETKQNISSTELEDQRNIVKVTVHHCEIKSNNLLVQPVVCMHIIDSSHGSYVKKQDRKLAATSYYENQREDIDYIMPIMSQPCVVSGEKSQVLKWEESFILNESLEYLLRKELNTILFFEIIDLIPLSFMKHQYERLNGSGMQKKAWAFLKVLGSNGIFNTGKMLRLQLYKSYTSRKKKDSGKIEVYNWWLKKSKVPLQASIYISFEKHRVSPIQPALRSMLPLQAEIGSSVNQLCGSSFESASQFQNVSLSDTNSKSKNEEVVWSKKEGEPFKIPSKLSGSFDSSNFCQILKFSTKGRVLAAGCELSGQHFLYFYEIPSKKLIEKHFAHSDIIYDIDWSKEDTHVLTASADCSVKLWNFKPWVILCSFIHPSYVYSSKFEPSSNSILVTACYDHVIRIWSNSKSGHLLQELEGHNSPVNSVCWHPSSHQFFSADNNGEIKLWKVVSNASKNFDCCIMEKEICLAELKGTSIDKIFLDSFRNALFIFCDDGKVYLMDVVMESILRCFESIYKSQTISKGCCSPCRGLLFVCNDHGKISAWNSTSDLSPVIINTLHSDMLTSIDYHPFEHMMVVCSSEENGCIYLFIDDDLDESLKPKETNLDKNANETSSTTSTAKEFALSSSHKMYQSLEETCSTVSHSKNFRPGTEINQEFSKLSFQDHLPDRYLSDSSASSIRIPRQYKNEFKKTESFTAVITKSGQFDVVAVGDSCTESDNYGSGSSKSIQPEMPKKFSKRSLRRKKLREGNSITYQK